MTKLEKKLLSIYRQIDQQSQSSLIDFAEFLQTKDSEGLHNEEAALEVYTAEDPPENESVMAAIKRLQRSYNMIETNDLFNEASGLMSLHMVQGRPADEVIAELEALFDKNYQSYLRRLKSEE